ncbi:MAG: ribosome silencing factor [Bacteroidota bacterium]|nr:ribosome silencing factor [Bacteroidota bacterium]
MRKKKPLGDSEQICELVVKGLQEKKGEDIAVIDLRTLKNAVSDFFVVCSGTSGTHIDSLSDSVEDIVHKGIDAWPWHSEGRENKEWILLDYVNVVAHIFIKDRREFYGIEELWSDAPIKKYN